jgi:hypothetical protein
VQAVRGQRQDCGIRSPRVEPEGRHPSRCLPLVEAVILEVFEQVARETQLRGADRPTP